jgi:pilus assembly protein CpaB
VSSSPPSKCALRARNREAHGYKLALVISLVLGIAGIGLLSAYLHRFEVEKSGGAPVSVLVIAEAVKRDAPLAEGALSVREIPAAYVDSRAIRATDKKRILGITAVNALQPGQTLTWTDVAVGGGERRSLSSLVQPGFRAFNLKTRPDGSTFDLVEPGDRVDLISTVTGSGGQRTTSLLLQNVLVLAVGANTGDEAPGPRAARGAEQRRELVLTLSLKVENAQLLALSLDKGPVSIAVRNPDDVRLLEAAADIVPGAVEAPSRLPLTSLRREARAGSRPTKE